MGSGIERPLPHSLEAERSILGAVLLGGVKSLELFDSLQTSDFFFPQHQLIFRHLRALRDRKMPTDDSVVLCESLQQTGELEAAGNMAYISQIPDGLPRATNLAHYVHIVRVKSRLRRNAYIAEAITEKLLSPNINPEEVLREVAALSAPLGEEFDRTNILKFTTGAEIGMQSSKSIEWIVPGFVAKGGITELGAKVKAGKTTLILKLVRAVADGGDFLGQKTLKTATVYLTEQPIVSFRQAMERADLLGREDFHVLLHTETRGLPWPEVASEAVRHCKQIGSALLVVDTLPHFAGLKGDSENNSGDALQAMQPLLQAAASGIATLLSRHERKAGGDVGDSGRGSSAFAGAADILLSLRKPEGKHAKTQRVIQAVSRFSETPAALLIDLVEGRYLALGDPGEAAIEEAKTMILSALSESKAQKLDLKALTKITKLTRITAYRAAEALRKEGRLNREGYGKRGKPYLYERAGIVSVQPQSIDVQKDTNASSGA